jgi:hypothetical protein
LVIAAGRLPREPRALRLLVSLALVALTAAGLNTLGNTAFVAMIPAVTLAAVVGRVPGALATGVVALVVALPFAEAGESAFGGRGTDGVLELEFILMALTVTVLVLATTLDARDDAMADLTARPPPTS